MQPNDSRPSFLDQVLSDTVSESTPTPEGTSTPITPLPPKKKRDPITPAQMMRVLGALILVGLIFFGTFLAYIVFNPGQAQFFIRFGINPGDVATLLQTLVNGIFGSLTFLLSITWIFLLFKAIITKKEYRRRKTLYIIGAFCMMLVLFSNIGFWAFLFQKIGASDFIKPNGGVTAYFNDLYLSDTYKDDAEIYDFNNLIGPLTVRYALASDVKYVSKSINISKFEIDCDGDGSPEHEGSDPALDNTLTCQFDRKGQFEPTGRYFGTDTVTREETTMPMAFIPVKIAGVVNIRQTDTNTVFDGSELEAIGNLVWREGKDFETIASEESKFTTKIEEGEKYICLVLRK